MNSPLINASDTAALTHLFPLTEPFNQNNTKDGYITACLSVNFTSMKAKWAQCCSRMHIISFSWQNTAGQHQPVSAVPQRGHWGQRGAGQCVHRGPTRWRYSAAGWWPQHIAENYWLQQRAAASASSCPERSRPLSGGSKLSLRPEEGSQRESVFL